MKVRKLKKILNKTGYTIGNYDDYIAIGGGYIHNIISVNKKTLNLTYVFDTYNKGKESINNPELEFIWDKLQELINSGEIHDIINGNDEIDNPLPVYTVENGDLIETWTDAYGWPNTTIEGKIMYENTHFNTKKGALENGIKECQSRYEFKRDLLEELKEKVQKTEDDISYTNKTIEYLIKLLENERDTNA